MGRGGSAGRGDSVGRGGSHVMIVESVGRRRTVGRIESVNERAILSSIEYGLALVDVTGIPVLVA